MARIAPEIEPLLAPVIGSIYAAELKAFNNACAICQR